MKGLFLLLVFISINLYAQGRQPAVEDFVGVEPEGYIPSQKGTEVLFNFNQNIKIEDTDFESGNFFALSIMGLMLLLPFGVWLGIRARLPSQPEQDVMDATNVRNLDDYREKNLDSDSDDDFKKSA